MNNLLTFPPSLSIREERYQMQAEMWTAAMLVCFAHDFTSMEAHITRVNPGVCRYMVIHLHEYANVNIL